MNASYLETGEKISCFGCEACIQACHFGALRMEDDNEGFRYPKVDNAKCVNCGQCLKTCPVCRTLDFHDKHHVTFGGYVSDADMREESTSGGAFSAIALAWCDKETVVFGAETIGLDVRHSSIVGVEDLQKFRKSKYVQSSIGNAYMDARNFLASGHKVLFSGTPCQIAGLFAFLGNQSRDNLLTIEVVCEGVPSPYYIRNFSKWLSEKKNGEVQSIDYRFKDNKRWDFQVMQASLQNPNKGIFKWKIDRWFNPFWSIWLQHLMSRPSCYSCPFARKERIADITLGDLWGVHLYCPELYGHNGGASLVVCNTEKGKDAFDLAKSNMIGHELKFDDALRYQGPMRGHIKENPLRKAFMDDLVEMDYQTLVRKWAKRPSIKLLFQKYVWGNRQKIWWWNLWHRKAMKELTK